jgi:hypothetical protein
MLFFYSRLIQELAIYEREPDAVEITVETLQRDGFGKQPRFYVILAVEKSSMSGTTGGSVVGMAFFYPIYSTWQGLDKFDYLNVFLILRLCRII